MLPANVSSAIVAQGGQAAQRNVAYRGREGDQPILDQQDRAAQIPNLFTNDEIINFFRLYRDGRVGFSRAQPQHLTRFTALEDFIIETRKTNGCIADIATLDILSQDNQKAALMRTWFCNVAPSCVYRHRSMQFGQTIFFICCFSDCATPCSSQFTLVRHYREQHFERLPAGIFGDLVLHLCPTCGVEFKRLAHLQQHLSSNNYLSRKAMQGEVDTFKMLFIINLFSLFSL